MAHRTRVGDFHAWLWLRHAAKRATLSKHRRFDEATNRAELSRTRDRGSRTFTQLSPASREGPLLSRHLVRQRVFRSGHRRDSDLRQRQRRRGQSVAQRGLWHTTFHGAGDRPWRSCSEHANRSVLACRALVLHVRHASPARREKGAGDQVSRPAGDEEALRHGAAFYLRSGGRFERARPAVSKKRARVLERLP